MHLLKITIIVVLLLSVATAETVENNKALPAPSPLLHPGKLDSLYSTTEGGDDKYNLMFWSPVFKGGYGRVLSEQGKQTKYGGGFFRPFVTKPNIGDLIVGVQSVESEGQSEIEMQGEYRFPFGFGFGGGFVERSESDNDVEFAKLSYRNSFTEFHYILSVQSQESLGKNSLGGYSAFYNDSLMGVLGSDGEQWRGTFGYIAPHVKATSWRPSMEIFYVDNSIGKLDGPKFLFVNATLGFRGGFLSHPARLGRAMGPTGLEFGNPLGFLSPTFNRRLNVWELGGIANFRLEQLDLPNGTNTEVWETALFPWQIFDVGNSFSNNLFIGTKLNKSALDEWSSTQIIGYFGKIGAFVTSVQGGYNYDNEESSLFLGLIYPL
jgi:hypothetical protein